MQISAEVRWFFSDAGTVEAIRTWFHDSPLHPFEPGSEGRRVDEYLSDPNQSELGIKRRGGGGTEIKGLISSGLGRVRLGTLEGEAELWCKWSTEALRAHWENTVRIEKTRWLRKFAVAQGVVRELQLNAEGHPVAETMPDEGCNVELTSLELAGEKAWWTFGLEAFGRLDAVERTLELTTEVLNSRMPPHVNAELCASYPEWMGKFL